MNFAKSELSFSSNVSEERREEIQESLGVVEVEKHEKYLGLPTMVGRSKKVIFTHVQDRIWKKLKRWKEKSLSAAGKEILIKAVAQAIPTYTMSCFLMPSGLCREIEQLMCNFWWGDGGKKKIHWMSWHRLCMAKERGGMGFRDLESFNIALLAKQGWRIIENPDSLLARLLKARYFPRSSFLEANPGHNPSYAWRSLIKARDTIQSGSYWRVGNGHSISAWSDRWILREKPAFPLQTDTTPDLSLRVVDLIN